MLMAFRPSFINAFSLCLVKILLLCLTVVIHLVVCLHRNNSRLITLLYKCDDCLEKKNWRPITLLCVDYKIVAKAIANRLLQVLPLVIHSDQTCGVRDHNPTINRRMLQDIFNDINRHSLGVAVLSLDQEKAFDRVCWTFLLRILQPMNFSLSFCKWILLFYTQIFPLFLLMGKGLSTFLFHVAFVKAVRFRLCYVIMAETIACAIRHDPVIDGFSLQGNRCIKLCQYGDDSSIIVMSDAALTAVFALFKRYELASCAKLNVTKVVYHLHQKPIWVQTVQMERKNFDWKIPFGVRAFHFR